jgi:hypothetical protein
MLLLVEVVDIVVGEDAILVDELIQRIGHILL